MVFRTQGYLQSYQVIPDSVAHVQQHLKSCFVSGMTATVKLVLMQINEQSCIHFGTAGMPFEIINTCSTTQCLLTTTMWSSCKQKLFYQSLGHWRTNLLGAILVGPGHQRHCPSIIGIRQSCPLGTNECPATTSAAPQAEPQMSILVQLYRSHLGMSQKGQVQSLFQHFSNWLTASAKTL